MTRIDNAFSEHRLYVDPEAKKIRQKGRSFSTKKYACLLDVGVLRKAHAWNDECDKAFEKLKEYLENPPLLSKADPREALNVYLVVSTHAVLVPLIQGTKGFPEYYTSQEFQGVEVRYPQMDMLAFAQVVTAWHLRPYLQAHPIKVLMETPLKKVLQQLDASNHLVNWAIELSVFDIDYCPQSAVKGSVSRLYS
ncbi:hypothetical protein F2P56_035372 [Juglans regia]|uniref:Reverse transcriptase/retrotransposon-derived protein RNase H-like domain-containing protein n=2 Tax=Juglans regia TaxID=51240 RepID=A0A833WBR2_JUGRE|nr:uncharacterized protein LOC109007468 [Juglans regia]KAF5442748.1 hypothetical protein F2P56_035372 [Juglans regia]